MADGKSLRVMARRPDNSQKNEVTHRVLAWDPFSSITDFDNPIG
jgi:hypothetical protein